MCQHAVSVVVAPGTNEFHEMVDAVQVLLDRDVLVWHVRLGDGAGTKDNRGDAALVHKVPNVTPERARSDAGVAAAARKYLAHSFVESPDMKNVYDGNVVLDAVGQAVVELPDYFDALNRDFRYQLTAIGAPGPNLYISEKISGINSGLLAARQVRKSRGR